MRLLVIDDNKDITDVIKVYCDSKNIDCQIANNAADGLAAISNNKFDLILLDVAMPEYSGLELAKNLKNKKMLDDLNIVTFTASSDPKLFEELENIGIRKILKKPFGIEEFEELIKRYKVC